MKYLVLLLVASFAISSSNVEAKPFIISSLIDAAFDGVSTAVNLAGEIGTGAIELGTGLANNALYITKNALTGGIEIAIGIGSSIKEGVKEVAVAHLSVFKTLLQSIDKVITDSFDQFKSKVVKKSVDLLQEQIKKLQSQLDGLLEKVKENSADAKKKSSDFCDEKEKEWTAWGEEIKKKCSNSSDETKQDIQDQIDAFIEASKAEIEDCTNGIVDKAEEISVESTKNVEQLLKPLSEALNQVQKCSEISIKDLSGNTKCAKELREKAEDLGKASIEATKLSLKIAAQSVGSVKDLACVPKTIAQIEKNKLTIAKAIAEIISEAENKESQTDAGEESTEPANE